VPQASDGIESIEVDPHSKHEHYALEGEMQETPTKASANRKRVRHGPPERRKSQARTHQEPWGPDKKQERKQGKRRRQVQAAASGS